MTHRPLGRILFGRPLRPSDSPRGRNPALRAPGGNQRNLCVNIDHCINPLCVVLHDHTRHNSSSLCCISTLLHLPCFSSSLFYYSAFRAYPTVAPSRYLAFAFLAAITAPRLVFGLDRLGIRVGARGCHSRIASSSVSCFSSRSRSLSRIYSQRSTGDFCDGV